MSHPSSVPLLHGCTAPLQEHLLLPCHSHSLVWEGTCSPSSASPSHLPAAQLAPGTLQGWDSRHPLSLLGGSKAIPAGASFTRKAKNWTFLLVFRLFGLYCPNYFVLLGSILCALCFFSCSWRDEIPASSCLRTQLLFYTFLIHKAVKVRPGSVSHLVLITSVCFLFSSY